MYLVGAVRQSVHLWTLSQLNSLTFFHYPQLLSNENHYRSIDFVCVSVISFMDAVDQLSIASLITHP